MKLKETPIDKIYCPILRLYKLRDDIPEDLWDDIEQMYMKECPHCEINAEKPVSQMIMESAALYTLMKTITNPARIYDTLKKFAVENFLNIKKN